MFIFTNSAKVFGRLSFYLSRSMLQKDDDSCRIGTQKRMTKKIWEKREIFQSLFLRENYIWWLGWNAITWLLYIQKIEKIEKGNDRGSQWANRRKPRKKNDLMTFLLCIILFFLIYHLRIMYKYIYIHTYICVTFKIFINIVNEAILYFILHVEISEIFSMCFPVLSEYILVFPDTFLIWCFMKFIFF